MGFTVSQSLEQNPRNLTEFENREGIIFEIRSIESIGEILFLGGEFRNSVIVLSFDKITCRTGERKIGPKTNQNTETILPKKVQNRNSKTI